MNWPVGRHKCLEGLLFLLIIAGLPYGTATGQTFRFAYQGDVGTLDPQALRETFTTEFLSNVMEPLVRYGEDLRPEPALAVRWERTSEDTWRFDLRKDVTFSNGNRFTADDVVFTYLRGSHPDSPMRGNISGIKRVEKVNDHAVDITTNGPYPLLLRELTALLIFDREWVEEHGASRPADTSKQQEGYLARHILGTGPFVVTSFRPDTRCVLEENPKWWDRAKKRHNLKKVEFYPIRSDSTRVAALLGGQVDMIFPCPLQDVPRIERMDGIRILEKPSLRTLFLGMDVASPQLHGSDVERTNPLRDLRVRRALYQAIDVETIVQRIMRGHAEPADSILSRGVHGYDERLEGRMAYDVDSARRLLAEAGYPGGFRVRLDCPNDRYVNDEEVCVAITYMLAKIGVKVDLRAQPKARYFQEIFRRQSDLFVLGWASADTMDAHSFVKDLLRTPGGAKGTFNLGGYSNARIDELESQIAGEGDEARRKDLLTEVFQIHKEEVGHIPLHTQHVVWAAREGVQLFQPPLDAVWLRFVRMR